MNRETSFLFNIYITYIMSGNENYTPDIVNVMERIKYHWWFSAEYVSNTHLK